MSASPEPEAGPSTAAPVFKKRSRPKGHVAPAHELLKALDEGGAADSEGKGPGEKKEQDEEEEEDLSVADLIALRNLQRRPGGIDLERLNQGEKKKKKKKEGEMTEEDRWAEQMKTGGLVTKKMKAESDDDEDNAKSGSNAANAPRLVKPNNFQGETNAVDVDKHMMEYIEAEMAKRRGQGSSGSEAQGDKSSGAAAAGLLLNPEDELYRLSDRYRAIQEAAKARNEKPSNAQGQGEDEEGSATLSSAMLSSVPEINLGMDAKIKNIEATERARRKLEEERAAARGKAADEGDDMLANARFFRHNRRILTDAEALSSARAEAANQAAIKAGLQPQTAQQPSGSASSSNRRKETATDDLALDRFKKRQRSHLKR